MSFKNIIPEVYSGFFSKNILSIDVTETKATCEKCLRARDHRFKYTYQPNLKCCTFHPFTPNYAVGGLLTKNQHSVGLDQIKNKISNQEFALPIGLIAPFDYQLKFLTKDENDFGRREDLLCPYYDKNKNRCSIWQYRGVVCTTFFCRSDYGQDGQKFWTVLSDYLSYVEMALAEECLVQLDFSPRDISDQLMYLNRREFDANEQDKRTLTADEVKAVWNGYSDLIQFYKNCFQIITKMNRKQFVEVIGEQGLSLEEEVIDYGKRRFK